MPDLTKERLTPPLMHAFRAAHRERDASVPVDIRDRGERVLAARRVAARSPVSESELRRLVDSDLVALLNTTNLASTEDLASTPEVAKSILNFGFPELLRRTVDESRAADIAREIETALRDFEPRLDPASIKVQRDSSAASGALRLRFLVAAELCMRPVNVPTEFVAEVEIDSGHVTIDRL
jgi:type VI secretion system protein ImpF